MILSVAITTKAGRTLVSRQFHYLTRTQVEGHLGAFPKLLSASNQSYIETESIRYVYQDLGNLYFVLITTTDSNILEDLDLLALLVELTGAVLHQSAVTEQLVLANSLDLIFAYDECVFDGYRQNLTVSEVVTFLAMESQAEDEFNQRRIEKEKQAQQELRKRMTEIQAKKRSEKSKPQAPAFAMEALSQTAPVVTVPEPAPPPRRPPSGRSGMDLQRKTNARDRTQQMLLEEGLSAGAAAPAPAPPAGFSIRLVETVNAKVTRHGQVREFCVEGRLIVEDAPAGVFGLQLRKGTNFRRFTTRAMKQKERRLFAEQAQLQFTGDGTFLGWRLSSTDAADLPFAISGFTADSGRDATTFSLGVELRGGGFELTRVSLAIPVNMSGAEVLAEFEDQVTKDQRNGVLRWTLPSLSADAEPAQLEFKVPRCVDDSFYPIEVEFEGETLFCDIDVVAVAKAVDGVFDFDNPVKCNVAKSLTQVLYEIV
jgi:hypothetical protein